ncbi:hypothetical protein [Leptotrichia sp.]|uniref:hypothetical protein n=1 Tax=Leptotrichia sp. TaxID=104608 RepID=UPI00179D3743|nr:hypothetical protein [Leptotrichia sp.]MBB1534201.1 hypothetical protein [Leptotrichia sp.]
MSESLKDIIEKEIVEEEKIEIAYSEMILLSERIEERIEELRDLGGFEDEIEEAEIALEDEEVTCEELKIILENLEEL